MIRLEIKSLSIRIDLLFLLVIPFTLILGLAKDFAAVFLSIFLHELTHVFTASAMGFRTYSLTVLPVGLNAAIDLKAGSFYKRVLVYLSGPLFNLAIYILLSVFNLYESGAHKEYIKLIKTVNAQLAVFNLIPVFPLDGGKIFEEFAAMRVGFFLAGKYTRTLSRLLSGIAFCLGLIQIAGGTHNFNLLIIGLYIYFISKSDKGAEALMNIKSIFYRRGRLVKKGLYPARIMVALSTTSLGEVLKNLDFDRFHLVYVLNTEFKLATVITEQEIIEGMVTYGSDLAIGEYIEKIKSV
ncbi:MAG: site-2 protease family protein [Bacillota bacterium]|nr:site-2 protease family protein [Bacillota bacterium]